MPISMKFISTSSADKLILLLLTDPRFIPFILSYAFEVLKNRNKREGITDRIIELKVKR